MMKASKTFVGWLLFLSLIAADAKRVIRMKAGNHYKKHEAVHIVVNKIGYVSYEFSLSILDCA
jgi:hypothetical protein